MSGFVFGIVLLGLGIGAVFCIYQLILCAIAIRVLSDRNRR